MSNSHNDKTFILEDVRVFRTGHFIFTAKDRKDALNKMSFRELDGGRFYEDEPVIETNPGSWRREDIVLPDVITRNLKEVSDG